MTVSAIAPITGYYDYSEVARSVLIAIAASYVALDLTGRVTAARGQIHLAWLSGGAIAMGIGIWAMHFKGMLAFHLPVSVEYHWPTILAALLVAIFASAFGLYVASRQKMGWREALTGSVIMGAGIAGLHYLAMAAMRLPAITRYSPLLVTASLLLAVLFSLTALLMAFDLREETRWTVPRRLGSAIVMGLAVSAMHYTGMAAASFFPAPPPDLSHAVSISDVGNNAIAIVTLIVLAAAMVTTSVDRRARTETELLNQDLERRVVERTLELEAVNQALRKEIAERKQAEEALKRSEAEARARAEELAVFFDAVPGMALISRDPACRRITGSRVAYELLRLPHGANISKTAPEGERPSNFRVVRDGQELPSAELPLQKAAATGQEVRDAEYALLFDDGTSRDIFGNAAPLLDREGNVRGATGVFVDITQRKRAEKSLQLFRMLLDQSNDAIEVVDPETLRFIDVNGRACTDLGYSREELLSMSIYDISPNAEALNTKVSDDLRSSGSAIFETLHRRKDGSTFPVEVSIKQVYLDRIYRVSVVRDITERKRAEEALQHSQAELARVARIATMGELTASIAHEINQPLAAVATNASASLHWLAVQPPNLDEARQAMANAMNEANRASGVIERLRTLLQKAPPQLRPVDVNQVIRDVLTLAHRELITGGVATRTELSPDLPTVLGDRVQLQQVVLNLIMNAIDAMFTIKDRPRTLLIKSARDAEDVVVEIQDSGRGLDAKQASHIFDSFFTTKPEGIGMGLSISRSIVEAHGGRLRAQPRSLHGAVFQVILPKAA